MLAQIGEVLGNFHLRGAEDLLKMADTKGTMRKEMQDAQPRFVTETLVNLNQLHAA